MNHSTHNNDMPSYQQEQQALPKKTDNKREKTFAEPEKALSRLRDKRNRIPIEDIPRTELSQHATTKGELRRRLSHGKRAPSKHKASHDGKKVKTTSKPTSYPIKTSLTKANSSYHNRTSNFTFGG